MPNEQANRFRDFLLNENQCLGIDDELYETLRIECGIPKYGVDMDENTVVPELGLDEMISYNKGCYVGQEIIARIHFRGHVAKKLTGLVFEGDRAETLPIGTVPDSESELTTSDGKKAGKMTSISFSPKFNKNVALAYVRYEFLTPGTELKATNGKCEVTELPFITV